MTNNIKTNLENTKRETKPGLRLFICGIALCIIGILLSIIWRINFSSDPKEISFVVTMTGIGIPIVLFGINTVLKPNLEDKISFIGFAISIISIISFMASYPNSWNYPRLYMVYVPYMVGIFLLIIKTFLSANHVIKEKEQVIDRMTRENDEIIKEDAIQNYISEFTNQLKKDIDKSTEELSKRTILAIHKHVSEKEQFKKDIDSFIERTKKEKDELKINANRKIIESLMRPISVANETLKRYENNKDANNKDMDIVNIIKKIKGDMYEILDNQDVEIINPHIGGDFDSSVHCVVDTRETGEPSDNKIVDVIEIGCRFKSGKPIKDAKVIVSENKQLKSVTVKDKNVPSENVDKGKK